MDTLNPSGTGRADIVYFNASTKIAEVYEIKPGSYAPSAMYHDKGYAQMMGYVRALNSGNLKSPWEMAIPGMTLNSYFHNIKIDSKLDPKKEIVYRIYENGMITYYYRNKQSEKEPSTATVPEGEKERQKNWGKLFTPVGILTIVAAVGIFAANFAENVLTGGVGIADDALCYSAIVAMILGIVGSDEVHEIEDCEEIN